MSTPEEIQNETHSDQPMDVAAAVGQLRVAVCGLAAGLILVSLALSGFRSDEHTRRNPERNAFGPADGCGGGGRAVARGGVRTGGGADFGEPGAQWIPI